MKKFLIILIIFFNSNKFSAQQYFTEKGITEFDGSKAAFEPIKAKNNSCISIFDFQSGSIAAVIKINEFKFRLGLMQEHFNENYLESNKYPKSTFEGIIENYESLVLSKLFQKIIIRGNLTIKGVKNNILAIGYIRKNNDKIELKSSFSIKLSDYDVKIPKIVWKKIDEEVKIKLDYNYAKNN